MIPYVKKAGSTDVSVVVRIIDSTDGTPETGVVFNTSGIDLQYRREGAASVAITEATLAALTTAHTDGGFLHIGNGYYRLDLPDAAVASGASGVLVHGTVTGMVVIGCYVSLVAYDPDDVVRLGLTALPNAAAEAAGGLYTRGTGAGQINQPANGMIDANVVRNAGTAIVAAAGRQEVNVTHVAGTAQTAGDIVARLPAALVGGRMDASVGAMAANVMTAAAAAADLTTELQSGLATAAALATVAGYIDTEISDIQSRLPAALVGGRMAADAVAVSGSTTAADNLQTAFDDSAGPVPWLGIVDQGVAQSATSTSVVLRAAAAFADDVLIGCTIGVLGSTQGYWQFREIKDSVGSTDTVTVDAWTVTPSGTITYKIFGGPPAPATPPDVNVVRVIGDPIVAGSSKTTNWGGTP